MADSAELSIYSTQWGTSRLHILRRMPLQASNMALTQHLPLRGAFHISLRQQLKCPVHLGVAWQHPLLPSWLLRWTTRLSDS
mmetsp:Transcript_46976/g.145387  ORF Transcript_46976/g.145387 Transcript_46976/m.145387 type:complete len:82 (-) Transcript_46976:320-565(-)